MKNRKENVISGEVEKKIEKSEISKFSPLEKTLHHSSKKEVDEVDRVIKEIVSEIKLDENYKKIEKKINEKELDEKEAMELGFKPDNYYSAKEKEDEENELDRNIEGSTGTMSGMQRSR